MALLLARTLLSQTQGGPPEDKSAWLSAREALEVATIGGARILGRDDIGSLEPGKCADFFSVDLKKVGFTGGSMIDPVAAIRFCAPQQVDNTVINGRAIVRNGQITSLDLPKAMERCNELSRKMINA